MKDQSKKDVKTKVIIRDEKKRIICKIVDERVMICRYVDMDKYTKKQLLYLWSEFTKENKTKLKNFLDFKNSNNDENEFCS